jgi:8-oxo-dGTP pyrophosphatase MutT (NUDIX family)
LIAFGHSSFAMISPRADVRLVSKKINHGVLAADLDRVEDIWRELGERGEQPPFEGTIINALDVTEVDGNVRIDCGLMSYRCLVARAHQGLRSIRPVAVSGFIERSALGGDEILVGRRATDATTHAGWYEAPPSGGLEASDVGKDGSIDVLGRLTSELEEETGINPAVVKEWKPFGLYYDDSTGTIDVVVKLAVGNSVPSSVDSSEEYDDLCWMGKVEIHALLGRIDAPVVDVSRWILSQWLGERR